MTTTLILSSPRVRTYLCASLMAAFFNPLMAAEDDYLKAIEAETESLVVDTQGVINASAAPATSANVEVETAAGPGDIKSFESQLQSTSRSLFRFYSKLNDEQKQEVFSEFQNNSDIKGLRPTIVRLYTGR